MALTTIPGSGINANSVVPAVLTEIQSSFNVGTGTLTLPNVSATTLSSGNVKTDNLLYANGSAYAFTSSAAGSNTQVQFNNNSSFAGSANLTFDTTTNTLAVTNIVANGAGLTSLAGANVLDQVGNALVAATVYTNAQPNITSVGTLTGLTVTGNVVAGNISTSGSGGNITGANVITANTFTALANITGAYFIGNGSQLTGLPASYTDSNVAAYLPTFTGNLTAGNATLGNLVTSNYFAGSGNNLSNIQGANVTGTVANATYSDTAGTVVTAAQPNITSTGTLTALTVTGNVVAGNISTSGSGGNITGANVITANTFTASANITGAFFIGNGSQLTGIAAGTSTTAVTVTASAQSNITSVGTLTSLATTGDITVGGNLTVNGTTTTINATTISVTDLNITVAKDAATASAANGAGITVAGAAATILYNSSTDTWDFNKTIVGNLTGIASSATVAATVTTAAQPNITSVGTLTDLTVSNSIVAGSGYGTVTTTQYASIFAKANGLNATSVIQVKGNDGTTGMGMRAITGGTSLLYSNAAIDFKVGSTIRDLDTPSGGTTIATIASTGLAVTGNITATNANLGNAVTANYFIGDGSLLTGIASGSSYTDSNVAAYLPTYTGNLTAGNANLGNNVSANYFTGSGAFLTSITAVTASTVTGNAQANITSLGTLTTLTVGNVTSNTVFGNGTITSSGNISFTGENVSLGDVGNVKITGGSSGYFITTDGEGNLSWGAAGSGGGGTSASGSNTQIQFNDGGALGASANLVFNKSTNTFTTGRIVTLNGANLGSNISNVYIGGGNDNQILKTDGAGNLSWVAQPVATIAVDNFTGDGTTTNFTLSVTPGSINQTVVNYNGAFQLREAYTVSGTTLTFSEAPISGSKIEVTSTLGAMTGAGSFVTRNYTGNGVQSTYSVTDGSTVSSVLVTENGLLQTPTVDYTISGSTLTFNAAPDNGMTIQIRELAIAIVSASTAFAVQDEGSNLTTTASLLNFVGAGVTASNSGSSVTVTIPSGGTTAAKAFGYSLVFGG